MHVEEAGYRAVDGDEAPGDAELIQALPDALSPSWPLR